MQSADLTVDNRCAMTKVVAFLALISFSRAACTWLSFALSKALVASSSNSTFGSRMTARAIATLCCCPVFRHAQDRPLKGQPCAEPADLGLQRGAIYVVPLDEAQERIALQHHGLHVGQGQGLGRLQEVEVDQNEVHAPDGARGVHHVEVG
mmetsp:Transcript_39651/g.102720  ORF Transcript_39651/g.102720 Transcript_39651/m.102720 type:complete len:151 (+) Transcript_39651:518-970(+)